MKDKVFGIGLGRTGTTSLNSALQILGYKSKHVNNIFGEKLLIYLKKIDAATDSPVAQIFLKLDEEYPNSKFIFTERNLDEWILSWVRHDEYILKTYGKSQVVDRLRKQIFGRTDFDKNTWLSVYIEHENNVKKYFQNKNNLLVWNINANPEWNLLCNFLDKEKPNIDFPHENKSNYPQY